MTKLRSIVGVIVFAISTTACINFSTVIRVNPDGSGFIEETLLVSRVLVEQFSGVIQGMAESLASNQQGKFEFPGLFDAEKLRARARHFGPGVHYVSGEKLVTETTEGYRAVYHFSDINLLRVDQNPGNRMGDNPLPSFGSLEKQFLTFEFQSGSPNTLFVKIAADRQKKQSSAPEIAEDSFLLEDVGEKLDPQMLAMFQSFFEDMRVAISLDIQGNIIGTNATHCDGSQITIMALDFGELLADANGLAYLQDMESTSLEDAQRLIQDLPGIKIELNDELVVQFQ